MTTKYRPAAPAMHPIGAIADDSGTPHADWIRTRASSSQAGQEVRRLLRGQSLHTVCEEAHCPNTGECWDQRTATVIILGDVCIRACRFCAVRTGRPRVLDPDEPRRVTEAIHPWGSETQIRSCGESVVLVDQALPYNAATETRRSPIIWTSGKSTTEE